MIKGFAGAMIAAAALSGCGESKFESQVKELVVLKLTDPQSAQFSDTIFLPKQEMACGAVNAKNQFGGYVGKRLWVYHDYGVTHQEDGSLKEFGALWDKCVEAAGLSLPGSPKKT